MLSPLSNVTYRRLFSAQVVALLGTGLATVALGLLPHIAAPLPLRRAVARLELRPSRHKYNLGRIAVGAPPPAGGARVGRSISHAGARIRAEGGRVEASL